MTLKSNEQGMIRSAVSIQQNYDRHYAYDLAIEDTATSRLAGYNVLSRASKNSVIQHDLFIYQIC